MRAEIGGNLPKGHPMPRPSKAEKTGENRAVCGGNWVWNRQVRRPRKSAVMSYLSGRHHLSRRAVEAVVETVFKVPISLGSVYCA